MRIILKRGFSVRIEPLRDLPGFWKQSSEFWMTSVIAPARHQLSGSVPSMPPMSGMVCMKTYKTITLIQEIHSRSNGEDFLSDARGTDLKQI